MIDVIKDYLVSLGVSIDQKGFADFKRTLKDADRSSDQFVLNLGTNFMKAGTIVAGVLTGMSAATAGIIKSTADADLKYQKLANTLWTTKENAKSMQIVLDAMGESMDSVAWIPELNAQYRQLIGLSNQMKAPAELSDQLKTIRGIGFEFARLKMEASYSLEWISYYLIKYLGEPLKDLKKSLSGLNDRIVKEMPRWTKAIAQGLSFFVKAGIAVIRMVKGLYDRFEKFWESLPKGVKKAALALTALATLMMSGPLGWMLAGLTAVILLLDDFFAYVDGRESSATLAPIWEKVVKVLNELDGWLDKASKSINDLYDAFSVDREAREFWELIKGLGKSLWDLYIYVADNVIGAIIDLYHYLESNGSISKFGDAISSVWEGLKSFLKGLTNVYDKTKEWFEYIQRSDGFRRFWQNLKIGLGGALDVASTLLKTLGDIGNIIGLLLQGKFAEAGKAALAMGKNAITGAGGGLLDIGTGIIGMIASPFSDGYEQGKGKYSLKKGYELEGVKPETMAALDYAAQAYKEIFGHELMVTAGTNGSHASGTYSHGNGWKVDVTDDWSNNSMALDPGKRKLFIQALESAGITVGDEYIHTNGENWTGGHLNLSAQNFRPPANSITSSNGSYVYNPNQEFNIYQQPGQDGNVLAREVAEMIREDNFSAAMKRRQMTGVSLQS